MSVSCQSVPILTTTIVGTSTSISEITTSFTTTLPDTTTTITTTSCTLTVGGVCAATETLTTTSTITGTTRTLPTTTTVPVTLTTTSTRTDFSNSCTTSTTSQSPTVMTTESTTTNPDGQVSTVMVTVTTTPPPPTGDTTTSTPPQQTGNNAGDNSGGGGGSPSNLGAIIGGTVGGIVGLAAIVLIIWFIIKRRRRWDDIFDHDEALGDTHHPDRRFSLSADLDGEPKPYQYGLVGHPGSSPAPSSPPMGSMTLSDTTASHYPPSQGYSDPYYGQPQGYNPAKNVSPLNLPVAGIATAAGGMQGQNQLHTPSSMSTSRPSTAGSTQPLSGPVQPTYPPGMQSYYNQQQQQQQQQQRGQSNLTSHSTSPSLNGPPLQPLNGWMMNTGVPPLPNQNQNAQQQQWSPTHQPQQLSDDFRAGSPISYQEPRRLQVANYRDSISTPVDEDGPVGLAPRTSLSSTSAGIAGMGAMGLGSRPSASASSVSPTEAPQRDGKGRIVSPGNVVVHTDGGRVGGSSSTPAPGGTSGESAPPAYTA